MISQIHVKDFQSLRDVSIELGKFTVIVGESGTGKSAFIRAVLKMSRNDAVSGTSSGEDWSHLPPAAKNAEVSMLVDDHLVQWVKGKDNKYLIDGETLNKVGKGCPDEVQDILRMREITFDGIDRYHLNFAQQFDLPFLLSDTGSRVAKILGEITNVNVLYAANREANKLKGSASRTLIVREGDLANQRLLLSDYASLPKDKKRLVAVLKLRDRIASNVVIFKELFAYLERLRRLSDQVVKSEQCLSVLEHMPLASKAVEEIFVALRERSAMRSLGGVLEACRDAQRTLKTATKRLASIQAIDTEILVDEIILYKEMLAAVQLVLKQGKSLRRLKKTLRGMEAVGTVDTTSLTISFDRYRNLLFVLDTLDKQYEEMETAQVTLSKAEEDLEEAYILYDEFIKESPICPLCENLLPHYDFTVVG